MDHIRFSANPPEIRIAPEKEGEITHHWGNLRRESRTPTIAWRRRDRRQKFRTAHAIYICSTVKRRSARRHPPDSSDTARPDSTAQIIGTTCRSRAQRCSSRNRQEPSRR